MVPQPVGWLRRTAEIARAHGALLIADEVMTGFGRTGIGGGRVPRLFASHHEGVQPDFLCLAKGLSGGYLPLAATLTTHSVFEAFLGEYAEFKAFFHGHSFTGNPLGAAVAREVLAVFREEQILDKARDKSRRLAALVDELAPRVAPERCRQLGMIAAMDLGGAGYLGGIGWRVYDEALRRGAYCRPLGDTVYLAPPLNIDDADLERLCSIFHDSVIAALASAPTAARST
jgi:adenosylmethionine-8-amino-7-oxononanoate aminotransferase